MTGVPGSTRGSLTLLDQTALVEAAEALTDLRSAMNRIRERSPVHAPGEGPTAADNCRNILDVIDRGIDQLAVYLGGSDA